MLSGYLCMVCSLLICILDFSVGVVVDMAWILGVEIFHKSKKTKEKLKFPKVACYHSCFFRTSMVVNFFFVSLAVTFPSLLLSSLKRSQMQCGRFLRALSPFPLTNKRLALIRLHRSFYNDKKYVIRIQKEQ